MAYYTTAKMVAELSGRYGKVYNKAMLGVEWNNSGNTGKGQYYEGVRPMSFRPEPFSDIPFLNQVAVFAEEKAALPIGKTSLTLQAGGRFTYMATDQLNDKWAVDPRFNAKYTIISNRAPKKVRELSLRAGWGIQTTLPALRLLYPFPVYIDRVSFSWGGTAETGPVAAWTTFVTPQSDMINRDLKMQYSKNFEVGLDFDMFGVKEALPIIMKRCVTVIPFVWFRRYCHSGNTKPIAGRKFRFIWMIRTIRDNRFWAWEASRSTIGMRKYSIRHPSRNRPMTVNTTSGVSSIRSISGRFVRSDFGRCQRSIHDHDPEG